MGHSFGYRTEAADGSILDLVTELAVQRNSLSLTGDAVHSEIDAIPYGTTLHKVHACAESADGELMPTENLEVCGGAMRLGSFKTVCQCTTSR